jgi:hypothetical protein
MKVRPVTGGQRAVIERTSPIDLLELASDLPGSPMQVAAVLVLGAAPGLDLAAVRDAVGERLLGVPRLRQRLVRTPFGGGRPVWVDDRDFDIRHHVDTVRCPAPGDETALLGVAATTATRRLADNRPLWSATLVTSLADGGAALIVVLHHVLADGIGGLAVLARLVDGAPTPASPDFPRPPPSHRALVGDALGTRLRALTHLPAGIRQLCSAVAELTTGGPLTADRRRNSRVRRSRRALPPRAGAGGYLGDQEERARRGGQVCLDAAAGVR